MPDDEDFQLPEDFDLAPQRTRRFAPEELVSCAACERSNPPTRMNCLYCGEQLPVTKESARMRRPSLRPLEEWERGFNVVTLPRENFEPTKEVLEEAASFLRLETGALDEIVRAGSPLPVARAATKDEAALVQERLAAFGFSVETFSDEDLAAETSPPMRVRRLEFGDETLRAWTAGGEAGEAKFVDVEIIVVGRIFTKRIELEERRGRLKPGAELADAREITTDEAALEIYAREDATGWRIMAGNFDYACLGERKSLLASENFLKLADKLRSHTPRAVFDDDYARLRRLLEHAWPPVERTESGGLRRERPGKLNPETVTRTTNDALFTRYARLRRALLDRGELGELGDAPEIE